MIFEELKESLFESNSDIHSYIESSEDYIKLKSFKVFMKGITYMTKIIVIGTFFFIALLIVSMAMSFELGKVLGNTFYGFLIVGVFHLFIGILCYFLKDKLNKPLLRKFSKFYFDKL